jgi:hypothetical protein
VQIQGDTFSGFRSPFSHPPLIRPGGKVVKAVKPVNPSGGKAAGAVHIHHLHRLHRLLRHRIPGRDRHRATSCPEIHAGTPGIPSRPQVRAYGAFNASRWHPYPGPRICRRLAPLSRSFFRNRQRWCVSLRKYFFI